MAVKEKTIYVYDDFSGPEPLLIGCLYVTAVRGGESCAFEYNDVWLKSMPPSIFLDPELMPFPGRQYPYGKSMFGMFADSTPDRWGRILMNKRERIQAEKESRKPKKLYGSDYLIGVCDETRMGGSDSRQIRTAHICLMTWSQLFLQWQGCVHLKKYPETSKMLITVNDP